MQKKLTRESESHVCLRTAAIPYHLVNFRSSNSSFILCSCKCLVKFWVFIGFLVIMDALTPIEVENALMSAIGLNAIKKIPFITEHPFLDGTDSSTLGYWDALRLCLSVLEKAFFTNTTQAAGVQIMKAAAALPLMKTFLFKLSLIKPASPPSPSPNPMTSASYINLDLTKLPDGVTFTQQGQDIPKVSTDKTVLLCMDWRVVIIGKNNRAKIWWITFFLAVLLVSDRLINALNIALVVFKFIYRKSTTWQ